MVSKKQTVLVVLGVLLVAFLGFSILPRLPELLMAFKGKMGPVGNIIRATGVKPLKVTGVGMDLHIFQKEPLSLVLWVKNPNSMSAKLDGITYKVFIEGKKAGSGKIPQTTTIDPHSTAKISNRLNPDLGVITGGAKGIWDKLTGRSFNFRVKGKVHVNIGPTSFDIPFSKTSTLSS